MHKANNIPVFICMKFTDAVYLSHSNTFKGDPGTKERDIVVSNRAWIGC